MRNIYITSLLLLGLLFAIPAQAQHPSCDGIRYQNFVFPTYDSTIAVQFGQNTTYGGQQQTLFMDIFEPSGDVATNRPAIVMAFGGSFILGQRGDVHSFCRTFARLGYVAVAIDYRLFDNFLFTDSTQAVDAVVKATHDMKAAVRFLREDAATANNYRIDPNIIMVGGVSAGAITAAHTAYLDTNDAIPQAIIDIVNNNGGIEGNSSTNTQYSSAVQGVISYSGALKDATWMNAGEAPIYSAHDDGDNTVPYDSRSVQVGFGVTIHLEGSGTITDHANSIGVMNDLYTVVNSGGHVSYFQNTQQTADVMLGSIAMMYSIVCPGTVGIDESPIASLKVYPNPASDRLHLEVSEEWNAYRYQLYDLNGRVVLENESFQVQDQLLNIDQFARGMYILRVTNLEDPKLVLQERIVLE